MSVTNHDYQLAVAKAANGLVRIRHMQPKRAVELRDHLLDAIRQPLDCMQSPYMGICALLEETDVWDRGSPGHVDSWVVLREAFRQWPWRSGSSLYPVPSPEGDAYGAGAAYAKAEADEMWDREHPYGRNRLALCAFIVHVLDVYIYLCCGLHSPQ